MPWSSGLPRRTGHRVFPSTALRRHWPVGLSDIDAAAGCCRQDSVTCHTQTALSAPRPPKSGRSSDRFTSPASDGPSRELSRHVNSLAALMHSLLVTRRTAEVRPYAQGELCCLARRHFRACPTPAPAITRSLIHNAFALRLSASEKTETVRASDSTSFLLSQHAITLTPGPSQVLIPITSLQAMAFAHSVGARRVSDIRRFVPAIRLSQQINTGSRHYGAAVFA